VSSTGVAKRRTAAAYYAGRPVEPLSIASTRVRAYALSSPFVLCFLRSSVCELGYLRPTPFSRTPLRLTQLRV